MYQVEQTISQKNRKPSNKPNDENASSIDMSHLDRVSSTSSSCLVGTENARRGGTRRCRSRGGGSDIYTLGVLSSARVIGTARTGAGIGGALGGTLSICLGTDVEWHGLGVLRGVGGDIVAADARVAQVILFETS